MAANPVDDLVDRIDQLVNDSLAAGPEGRPRPNSHTRCPKCWGEWHGQRMGGCPGPFEAGGVDLKVSSRHYCMVPPSPPAPSFSVLCDDCLTVTYFADAASATKLVKKHLVIHPNHSVSVDFCTESSITE